MNTNCQLVRSRLEAYVDGELEPALGEAVRVHISGCAGCAADHSLAVSIPARLRALAAPPPPDALVAGVMRRVGRPATTPLLAWGLPAAEVVLAALILAYLSGLDGVARLAGATAGDVGQLVSWGLGAAQPPPPASTDLFLTLAAILLVAVCSIHIVVLGRPPGRRLA